MIRVVAHSLGALLTAMAAAWLGFQGLPDGQATAPLIVSVVALAVIALRTFLTEISAAIDAYEVEQWEELQIQVRGLLGAALWTIINLSIRGLDPADIGLSAFMVRRVRFRRRLVRLDRLRLSAQPGPTSGIVWRKGKGVIGQCWSTVNIAVAETKEAWAPFHNVTRREWNRQRTDIRLGMPYRDFKRMRTKYVGALAVPCGTPERATGVLAIDVANRHDTTTPFLCLLDQELLNVLQDAAGEIGEKIRLAVGR